MPFDATPEGGGEPEGMPCPCCGCSMENVPPIGATFFDADGNAKPIDLDDIPDHVPRPELWLCRCCSFVLIL